ncbi:SHOCT domain-containing protein [Demequina capsici]|uniref:SHOCT domain-containing protein n=1 Tax=Demequina capsici TaxID=3075620 RepID=A0AA96FBQ4_9MICO|nr:SHOCT domain-containing protein [Demequina sp. PMTSA13]WNM26492.1 SHOCT domain-containing protein [Demequina sp. PMTSA13]
MMGYWGPGHGYMSYGVGAGGWLMGLFLVVGLAALVYVAVRLATRDRAPKVDAPAFTQAAPAPTSARQILEDRLARGEIDAAEFRERVKALEEV